MNITPRVRRILTWVGYPALYLVLFCLFAYWTFPYDRLKSRIESGFNATQTGADASRLQIGEATWSWRFPGVVLSDINLIPPPAKSAEPGAEAAPPQQTLHAVQVYATVSPLSLLFGTVSLTFRVNRASVIVPRSASRKKFILPFGCSSAKYASGAIGTRV